MYMAIVRGEAGPGLVRTVRLHNISCNISCPAWPTDVHFLWRLGRFLSFISLIYSLESGDISRNFFDGNGRNGRNGRIVTVVTAMVFLFPPAPQLAASKKVVTAPFHTSPNFSSVTVHPEALFLPHAPRHDQPRCLRASLVWADKEYFRKFLFPQQAWIFLKRF